MTIKYIKFRDDINAIYRFIERKDPFSARTKDKLSDYLNKNVEVDVPDELFTAIEGYTEATARLEKAISAATKKEKDK